LFAEVEIITGVCPPLIVGFKFGYQKLKPNWELDPETLMQLDVRIELPILLM
jgi:hypothetical protein